MNELTFDEKGLLTPYTVIDTDWPMFTQTFGWTEHRRNLIGLLYSFLSAVNQLGIGTLIIWIDGSFVTRKERPNDIDAVFVIPSLFYREFEQDLYELRDRFEGLDGYFVRQIDRDEQDYNLYISDRTEWLFQFTTTRLDQRTKQKYPKGFLQIIWNYEPTR